MHMEMWKFNNIDDNGKDDNDGQRTNVYLQNCSIPEKLLLTDKIVYLKNSQFSAHLGSGELKNILLTI